MRRRGIRDTARRDQRRVAGWAERHWREWNLALQRRPKATRRRRREKELGANAFASGHLNKNATRCQLNPGGGIMLRATFNFRLGAFQTSPMSRADGGARCIRKRKSAGR